MDSPRQWKLLIVGGTIKAGTSSIFTYLSAHPQISGSFVKETLFFINEYSGDPERDLNRYQRYFAARSGAKIVVEASPGYLGYKEDLAPRIHALVPDARLLFVLRDPVDRLYSYFNFAKAKLELPFDMTFERYLDLCEQYGLSEGSVIDERHARAMKIGQYSTFLKNYLAVFPARQVKVAFYEDLRSDPVRFMVDLCEFIGIDPAFYKQYAFQKINVTFSGRIRPLHRVALALNRAFEPVLRQRPELKACIRRTYKRLNQSREGYPAMTQATRLRLAGYYAGSNAELITLLQGVHLPTWIHHAGGSTLKPE